MSLEEQKKLLLPFLQRAEEVQKAEPKIAYYCRLYAVEQALQIPKDERLPEINGLLGALLAKLEKDRAVLQLSKDDSLYCENFALTIFSRADRADRAGRADKNTALTFYAASFFMEILNQFGELQQDVIARQRYAAWRAAEIRKAIKEGRAPTPPPAANNEEVSSEDQDFLDSLAPAPGTATIASSDARPAHLVDSPPSPPFEAPDLTPRPDGHPEGSSSTGGDAVEPASDGERLPSPPKRQLSKQMSVRDSAAGAAWVAPPPRAFSQFQKVLYFTEGGAPPQPGTIAKIEASRGPGTPPTYYVALKDRIVQAEQGHLALCLAKGDRVAYYASHGQRETAVVEEVDTGHWPPSYLVHVDGGSFVETIDDRLEPLEMSQAPEEELEKLRLEQQAQQQAQQAAGVPTHPPPPVAALQPPTHQRESGPLSSHHPPPAEAHSRQIPQTAHPNYPPPPSAPARSAPSTSQSPTPPHTHPTPTSLPGQRHRGPEVAAGKVPSALGGSCFPAATSGYEPSLATITEAQKLCKMATSALSFEDVPTALKHLGDAFRMLSQPQHAAQQEQRSGGAGRR